MNKMQEIRIEKITLNAGVGEAGDKLEKAARLLKNITGMEPLRTSSKKRIPTWGVRPGLGIACMVTLRGKKAEEVLRQLFEGVDGKLPAKKFDKFGNFSFGITEYINIPDVQYDVEIGIIGFNVAVTLERPGFRVKRRRVKNYIGSKHKIKREDAITFIKSKFGIEVEE